MAPNPEGRKNYWKTEVVEQLIEQSEDSDSDSDQEVDLGVPRNTPEPEIWFHVGRGFQVLLDFFPEAYERYFIAQLLAWLQGEPVDPSEPEPPVPRLEEANQLTRDFYSRGLRYYGQLLTPQEVDEALDDFFSFYTPQRAWDNIGMPEPPLLYVQEPQQLLPGQMWVQNVIFPLGEQQQQQSEQQQQQEQSREQQQQQQPEQQQQRQEEQSQQ